MKKHLEKFLGIVGSQQMLATAIITTVFSSNIGHGQF